MGQANRAYVEKRYDDAIKLIMDVIRHEPNSHETYRLLALIYDEIGQKEKSFGYYSIAAHLTPKDANLWKTLAIMSKDVGQSDQTLYYLSKAVRADSKDAASVWQYVEALKAANNKRKVTLSYQVHAFIKIFIDYRLLML